MKAFWNSFVTALAKLVKNLRQATPPTSHREEPEETTPTKTFGPFAAYAISSKDALASEVLHHYTGFPSPTTFTRDDLIRLRNKIYHELSPRDHAYVSTLRDYVYALEDEIIRLREKDLERELKIYDFERGC